MLKIEEIEKMKRKLENNRKYDIFPSNISELALLFSTSRQAIYNSTKNNKCPLIEEKIKEWVKKERYILKVDKKDTEKLSKYGFKPLNNGYVSQMFKNENGLEHFYTINEKLELSLMIKGKKGVFQKDLLNLDIIYDMIKDEVLKKAN